MKYIANNDFDFSNTCVTFGYFDGIHVGHSAVISKLWETSKVGMTSVLISFDLDESLLGEKKLLSTEEEKRHLLEKNGPDIMISYKVRTENVVTEAFIKDVLIEKLGTKVVVAGTSYEFIGLLRSCATKFGFKIVECADVLYDRKLITSERILKELVNGTIAEANKLLGHAYLIMGKVVHGRELGRTVGMPTVNLGLNKFKQLPAFGVFGTISEIDEEKVKGLTSIGYRPSVDSDYYITIETYLLNFSGDLYDKTIALEIHIYIREIMKFNNIEEVKAQVNKDVELIRADLDMIGYI
ncbi:MAG: riboflavin kinase [Clostridia bacterium]